MPPMSESRPQPLPFDKDYRQLLREQPGDDSSTDQDDLDLVGDSVATGSHIPPEIDVIGVSISRTQTYMKSPEIPVVEKALVVDGSAPYLTDEPASIDEKTALTPDEHTALTPPLPSTSKAASTTVSPTQSSPSSQASSRQVTRRSSMIRSILGESEGNRKRSLSGPTVLGAIKKFLPDMPSAPSFTGSPTRSTHNPKASTKMYGHDQSSLSVPQPPRLSIRPDARSPRRETVGLPRSPLGLDGNVESLLSPTSPRSNRSLTRSNSDGSLYLKRRPTQASAFDDTSAYADVSEMRNARFKAITDTFQNSTLRMPRLPTVRYNQKRDESLPMRSVDNLLQANTQRNTGVAQNGDKHQSKSVPKFHKPMKLIEVENPQQRAHPILSDALAKTTGDLVIMGGYRGSILRDAKPPHRQLWAPVKIGLNLRSVDLEVGLTREDEENASQKLYSSGILSHIGPIDICRRLLKHVRKCPNFRENSLRFHDWGYDWRLSPDLLGQRLITFLEGLECNRPDTPPEKRGAFVIAHSLGGLITRWAINRRPELFAGVVYAGVPQNCVNILGPLRNGDDVLLSSKILTAQVNFTMRTSFALLPECGRCFINKHTNERYDVDFFDPQCWLDYRLSPCISSPLLPAMKEQRKSIIDSISDSISSNFPSLPSVPGKRGAWFSDPFTNQFPSSSDANTDSTSDTVKQQLPHVASPGSSLEPNMGNDNSTSSNRSSLATASTIPLPQAKQYLARTLAEVKAFKLALAHEPSHQSSNRYPPNAIIFGKTVPTVYGARVQSREHIKYTDAFDDLAFAAGDGVVLASAAQLPDGYRCVKGGRVESDRGHVGLLGDLEGVGQCLAAVVEARARGVGMGAYEDI